MGSHDDEVLLVITHRRLVGRNSIVGVSAGWHTHLAVLEDALRGRTPRAFWNIFNALDAEYEQRTPADVAGETA